MEFRVCFTIAMYENDMLSLCETINVFIDAFAIPKSIVISKDRLTMLKSLHVLLGLSPVWNHYAKDSHKKGAT